MDVLATVMALTVAIDGAAMAPTIALRCLTFVRQCVCVCISVGVHSHWQRCHGTYDRVLLLNICLSLCVCLHVCMCIRQRQRCHGTYDRVLLFDVCRCVCLHVCVFVRLLTLLPWRLQSRCVIDVCLWLCVCLHVYMCIRLLTALPWHLRSRW